MAGPGLEPRSSDPPACPLSQVMVSGDTNRVGQGELECLLEERSSEAHFAGGEGSELPGGRRLFY